MSGPVKLYDEGQQSVSLWSRETFGEARPMRTAVRLLEEVTELLTDVVLMNWPKARVECADCLIVLYCLAECLGIDIHEEVTNKMKINRARKWKLDGAGCGQHIEEKS